MTNELQIPQLIDHLLCLYYAKIDILFNKQDSFVAKGALTETLCNMIVKTIIVLNAPFIQPWKKFLSERQELMLSCPKEYVWHVMKICLMEEKLAVGLYEKFITVCGLATAIGVDTYYTTKKKFHILTTPILTVFFKNIWRYCFQKSSDWKRLQKYISSLGYAQIYDELRAYKSSDEIPMKLKERMAEFIRHRRSKISAGIQARKLIDFSLVNDLTDQVISSTDASLIMELNLTTLEEKRLPSNTDKSFKPVSESVAARELSLEAGGNTSSDNKEMGINEQGDAVKHLSNFKLFTEPNSESESSSLKNESDSLADNLLSTVGHIQQKIESIISIFNLL